VITASEIFNTIVCFACPTASKEFTEKMLFCLFCALTLHIASYNVKYCGFSISHLRTTQTQTWNKVLCVQMYNQKDVIKKKKKVLMSVFAVHLVIHWNVFIYRSTHTHTHTHTHIHKDWTVSKIVHFLSHTQATLLRITTRFILATSMYNLLPALYDVLILSQILNSWRCYSRYSLEFHASRYVASFVMLLQPTSK
jgi:hypothetical protein